MDFKMLLKIIKKIYKVFALVTTCHGRTLFRLFQSFHAEVSYDMNADRY